MGDEKFLTRIRPFLEKATVDDDQILIHQVQTALSTNLERTSKHFPKREKVKVNQVESTNEVKKGREESIFDAIGALSRKFENMEREVRSLRDKHDTNTMERDKRVHFAKKCKTCEENKVWRCVHCWKCGKEGHQARRCQQEN